MFFRKPGLPILMVRMPDGKDVPYWNTFYQEVQYKRPDAQDLMDKMEIQYLAAQRLSERVAKGLDEGKKPSEIDMRNIRMLSSIFLSQEDVTLDRWILISSLILSGSTTEIH